MAYTQAALISTGVIFPAIGFALVCLRFWMRVAFQKTFVGVDDWLILAASILVIGMAVDAILASFIGTQGMDGMPVIESHEEVQKKIDFSTLVFEKPAYGAVKLSVLFFFRRIFTIKKFRVVNNYLIALIVAWTLAFFFADLFSCGVHPEANWDPQAKEKYHCINLFAMLLTFAVTDVVTDIAILWMPYPQIKNLHMSTRDRWGLAGIFLMGTLDLVIGIVRLGFIVANQTIPAINSNFNPPESTAPTFWTVVEVAIGVIAANLPALAPLFREKAKLGSRFSSLRKLFSRSDRHSSPEENVTAQIGPTIYPSSDEETRIGSVDVNALETQQKHKSEHVGMWDQFEREDNIAADETGRRSKEQHSSPVL